jgi:hypothetical protein
VQDLLDRILYPYQAPAFTFFQINGQPTTLELGEAVLVGSKLFVWGTSNSGNVAANSLVIRDVAAGSVLASGLANDGAEVINLGAIVRTTPSSYSFSIQGTNTQGASLFRSFDLLWRPRRFAGTIPAAGLADLQGVSSVVELLDFSAVSLSVNDLVNAKPGAASYNCSGGRYIWFLWDQSLGTATFSSGAAPAAFQPVQVVALSKALGVVRNYNLYVSSNAFNGAAVPISLS